jgi:hypothetical protein
MYITPPLSAHGLYMTCLANRTQHGPETQSHVQQTYTRHHPSAYIHTPARLPETAHSIDDQRNPHHLPSITRYAAQSKPSGATSATATQLPDTKAPCLHPAFPTSVLLGQGYAESCHITPPRATVYTPLGIVITPRYTTPTYRPAGVIWDGRK